MVISYAILTHNQGTKLQQLIKNLLFNKDVQDQIIILDDYSQNPQTERILKYYSGIVTIRYRHLNNNFSAQKNYLFDLCNGDYIFNLDADENIDPILIKNIKTVLQSNQNIQLY